jgi:hypothetical protein
MKIDAVLNGTARMEDGLADIRIRDENEQEHQLDLPAGELFRRCGVPSPVALDLLITASLCYITDKTVPRWMESDGWARELDLTLPVSEPDRWASVAETFSQTLSFLTGDVWHLHFYQAPHALFERPTQRPLPDVSPIDAVSLFSGGLDSLAGAIDLLAGNGKQKVLLLGHYDSPGPRKVQAELGSKLREPSLVVSRSCMSGSRIVPRKPPRKPYARARWSFSLLGSMLPKRSVWTSRYTCSKTG